MGNKGGAGAAQQRRDEERRQADIRKGRASIDETFSQFDTPFYEALSKSYVDFARPQLDEQIEDAREQTTFALARSGNLDSSTRVDQFADLDKRYGTALQGLYDEGRQYGTDARGSVESARADLVSNLQVTGDATGAANAAMARAKALATPPKFQPLEQLFVDATSGLAQQIALERNAALGSPIKPRVTTGLFAPKAEAVRVR